MTSLLSSLLKKFPKLKIKKHVVLHTAKAILWFSLGALVGLFFFTSFLFIVYRQTHTNTVYDGVMIGGIDFGGKTQKQVQTFYAQKNTYIQNTAMTLTHDEMIATISAKEIGFGFDDKLLAEQAFSIGRSNNLLTNMSLILQAYLFGVSLAPSYHYEEAKLNALLAPIQKTINVKPIDALFEVENGRVKAFRISSDGKTVDTGALKQNLIARFSSPAQTPLPQTMNMNIPVTITKPAITTDEINDLGITELIGQGTSLFPHSIANRVFNIGLASSRINGALIKPGETFSFTKTVGDISSLTGYKQAYIIENGRTVLGDGGGVCQVSTTLFRAALDAGLPIVERHPHAYRVSYYEADAGPGIDAATYYPSVDLKFKNDTDHHILIQTIFDPTNIRLTFQLFGTSDGRQATISEPVILSQSPAPEPLYQDDPTLPVGQVKQVDWAAAGAKVYFTRTVTKDGEVISEDTFNSNYRPWQAIYLRGTQQ
ncbi:MAG TPA: VanW family protein [Patescibacteria group bacterium]|nr:VanW family protein [Patescibacteria group bacterium]